MNTLEHNSIFYPSIKENANRAKLVNLIFLVYWLLIFEGALRKWILPELHQVLYFVKDPLVLIIYWKALKFRFYPNDLVFKFAMLIAFLMTFVVLIQVNTQTTPILVLLFGFRNYFFLIPLAFIIKSAFEKIDLDRLIRQTLMLSIPMAMLVVVQFYSSPDSFVNKGVTDEGYVMVVVENIVRTTGTFTYTAGQSIFCGSVFAILAFVWTLSSSHRPIKKSYLLVASVAVITLIALSGSRTVFFFVFLVLLAMLVSNFLIRDITRKAKSFFVPLALIFFGALIFIYIFPEALDAIVGRQQTAVDDEGSTIARAFRSFYQFAYITIDVPSFGYGIGSQSAGGLSLSQGTFDSIEDDEWTRLVIENGFIVAGLYILLRLSLAIKLFIGSIKALNVSGNSLSFILLSFLVMPLINGSITTQGTINGYVWLFAGFTMAASKVYSRSLKTVY